MQKLSDSNIHTLKLDVLLDADVEEVVSSIINREGRIDILVNNAGAATPGKIVLNVSVIKIVNHGEF